LLIACGQLTMCYNLIVYTKRLQKGKYLERVWNKLPAEEQKTIEELQTAMEKDWEDFKDNPFWLLEQNRRTDKA